MIRLSVIIIFLALTVAVVFAQAVQVAQIIYAAGTVKIKTAAFSDWVDAQVGMMVKEGDIVKTGDNSRVELAFGEGLNNIINIFPNSQLVISRIEPGLVRLEEGRIFSLIKTLKKGSTFEVRTPTAVAGARGTGWGAAFNGALSAVDGFEQTVYVAGLGAQEEFLGLGNLGAGWKTSIGKGGGPSQFQRLSAQEMDFWRRWKQEALRHLRDYGKDRPQDKSGTMDKLEHRAKILERVERETTRSEEIKRDRRIQGGSSEGSGEQTRYKDGQY